MTDKILSQSTFFYPIPQVTATFRYRKVGTPTVFDELVMSLANDFPTLTNNSLGQIAKMMQIDPIFLQHTLSTLVDLEVLEKSYFDNKLENVKILELKLTKVGQDFYRRKQMPGRRHSKSEIFFFNPLSQTYEKPPKISHSAGNLTLNESLFAINEDMLQVLSSQAGGKLTWFTVDVELEPNGISHKFDQTQWQSVKVKLSLDQNRYLHISSDDKLFGQWLAERSASVLREHLLRPLMVNAEQEIITNKQLQYDDNELRSLVLADQLSDLSPVKNAIAVKFSDKQEINENSPFVVFDASLDEAGLNGKHLSIPYKEDVSDYINQLFFQFQSRKVFVESKGYLLTYFDHQPQNLPVKILTESESGWIQDLLAFQQPNLDTLVFMANFISEDELVAKLPTMSVTKADIFHQRIQETWNKNFVPESWAEKISVLINEDELATFTKLFPKVPLRLSRFARIFQGKLLDNALENQSVQAVKVSEFADILKATQALQKLDAGKIYLNTVNVETLTKVQAWQAIYADFNRTVLQSSSVLSKKAENFSDWRNRVRELFEPFQVERKFAVLDTNFVMNKPKKLAEIQTQRTVILPKTVIYELDKLKQTNQKEMNEAKNKLDQVQPTVEAEQQKMGELTRNIIAINTKLLERDQLSEAEIKVLKNEKTVLEKQKQTIEKDWIKAENNQTKLSQDIDQLKEKGYKIREALRKIEELKLAEHSQSESPAILAMVVEQEKMVADDKILSIAARYKLNDVVLYTEDRNLKSKATSIGIKTA
ncbi:PIN domain-containing protein [Thiothrix subterranea]|uniref:PIN domain-containing protein n=1 Tax=Thiothrix subterranea TaxID=2735563 RepID=A0AA51R6I1_9GAMM|nr:PIN domain-containing protein [Thiothrix subterranea]WML88731.1 PIN domain-containing protein [Thiothrix subterranea]